jgi:hypothetical protein
MWMEISYFSPISIVRNKPRLARQPVIPGQFLRRRAVRLATAADVPQLCIHPFILLGAE